MTSLRRRVSGPVTPHRPTRIQRVLAALASLTIRANAASQRIRAVDPSGALATAHAHPVIFATWHNRLALALVIHHRFIRPGCPGRRLAAMVSASRDGALLAAVLEAFDVEPVRGSSSRRGPQALLELKSWADRGLDLAITPDGPRGPAYVVQPGIVALSQLTGFPIIPVVYEVPWKVRLRSWDRFQLPLPFGRCTIRFGEPLAVLGDSPEALDRARDELQRRLMAMTVD